jgi:hypothetical protein
MLDKGRVEEFRKMKNATATATTSPEDQPCILPEQPEPREISQRAAKQDMSDEGEEGRPVLYETDEEEFNPGSTSRGYSTRQLVT